jgi:uracil-DNA glycosylase family 4
MIQPLKDNAPPFGALNRARPDARRRSSLELQCELVCCRICPRLVEWRERVAAEKVRRFRDQDYWGCPVPAFGSIQALLVAVGLAPAAHGGNRTGRLFTGDRSGDWLFRALHRYGFANRSLSVHRDDGLTLHDCFITAAVRCAPPANKPTKEEIQNCRRYLSRELALLKAKRVIVVLGQIAFRAFLDAWKEIGGSAPRDKKMVFSHGAEYELSGGVILLLSYHPSQQNTQTGRLTRAMFHAIFRRARRLLDRAGS